MLFQKIQNLLKSLSKGIFEREEVMSLALLTAVAGESIFLLGSPGVAKSLLARRLKFAFADGKAFEYLMHKFSTPDEIFGPISIKKLKDEDKYERITESYLPNANVVFLDEIWKAGAPIQNALLTILNEKIYRNGEQEMQVNIHALMSASNEIPEENEGVDALWDRFLVRYYLQEIRQAKNFLLMLTHTEDTYKDDLPIDQKIKTQDLLLWQKDIDQITLPAEVLNTIQVVKLNLEEYNTHPNTTSPLKISDRRWKKIARLLRASAFLHDRNAVNLMDCFVMAHALWQRPEQFDFIQKTVIESIQQHGYSLAVNLPALRQEIQDFEQEVYQETRIMHQTFVDELLTVEDEYVEAPNLDQYFGGCLLKKQEFLKLSRQENQSISVYDNLFNLTNRIYAKLGTSEFALEVMHNAQTINLQLKTKKTEKNTFINRKPHPLVADFWEKRSEKILHYLKSQQENMQQHHPTTLQHLTPHLFVPAVLADVVLHNWTDVEKQLKSLTLQVEKLVFYYKN